MLGVVVYLSMSLLHIYLQHISWAMRKLGVEEWLVSAVMSEQSMVIAKVLR